MDVLRLQDRLAKASGLAARKYGRPFTVYRSTSLDGPIREQNRVIKLFAAFEEPPKTTGNGEIPPIWIGVFDSSYTCRGDYLVSREQTFFVAAQLPHVQPRCVLTNRTVTVIRPTCSVQGGYSGLYASAGELILAGWPANLSSAGGAREPSRFGSTGRETWRLLLPIGPCEPRAADVVNDDAGYTYVVGAAEQNILGWRLIVKRITA